MSDTCQKCNSTRMCTAQAHCSDMFHAAISEREHDGYVAGDLGIGGGDDVRFTFCLDCGQMMGTWPLPPTELEGADEFVEGRDCAECGWALTSDRHKGVCEGENDE